MNIGTGAINWPRNGELGWKDTGEGGTFVYAYFIADHRPQGLDLIDGVEHADDWFLRDPWAEYILDAHLDGLNLSPSPNCAALRGQRIIAGLCLGSNDGVFYHPGRDGYWWAGEADLTRQGTKIVTQISRLYMRPAHIITYLGLRPMNESSPEAALDPATVVAVSGRT